MSKIYDINIAPAREIDYDPDTQRTRWYDVSHENADLDKLVNDRTRPRQIARRTADRSHHETTVRSRIIWLLLWLILAIGYWCMGNNGLLTGTQSTVLTLICSGAALWHFWRLAQSVKPNT